MTDAKALISEELLRQMMETARAQNRQPAEVLEEAVARYIASQRLAWFAEKAERHAVAKGIREEDVPRLVEEVRRENKAHGR